LPNCVRFEPGCDAVMVQLPVLLSATVAEEIPDAGSIDWLPAVQEPAAPKLTCCPFAAPFDWAVAVTVSVEVEIETELGKAPRTIVWLFVRIAGGDGALCRCVGSIATGSRVVDIV
jgi:hypothetical protein